MDHLLLHCPVAHSLWVQMLQVFGIQWVMPGSVESLVFCWNIWLGKFSLDIWNMVPGCLMLVVWMERNRRSFEAKEKSLVQLQALCQSTLFDWARCQGSSNCSSTLEFLTSLSICPLSCFSYLCCFCCCFLCSPSWTPCFCCFRFFFMINIILITYKKI